VTGKEKRLGGTNASVVVKVDNTLRRPCKSSSEAVQALLRHVRASGFTACPEPLGSDEQGRVILSYVEGHGGSVPLRPETVTDETLVEQARLICQFHDASSDFVGSGLTWDPLLSDPSGESEIICHNDLSIPNMVFRHGRPIALVDWDFAAPGRRLWDLSYACWRLVPLHRPEFMRSIGWPPVDHPDDSPSSSTLTGWTKEEAI
jgi:Phosphotransferase enzyme family